MAKRPINDISQHLLGTVLDLHPNPTTGEHAIVDHVSEGQSDQFNTFHPKYVAP